MRLPLISQFTRAKPRQRLARIRSLPSAARLSPLSQSWQSSSRISRQLPASTAPVLQESIRQFFRVTDSQPDALRPMVPQPKRRQESRLTSTQDSRSSTPPEQAPGSRVCPRVSPSRCRSSQSTKRSTWA